MFRLQVTAIRQTFQYIDITCSVLTIWDSILFRVAAWNFRHLDDKVL